MQKIGTRSVHLLRTRKNDKRLNGQTDKVQLFVNFIKKENALKSSNSIDRAHEKTILEYPIIVYYTPPY